MNPSCSLSPFGAREVRFEDISEKHVLCLCDSFPALGGEYAAIYRRLLEGVKSSREVALMPDEPRRKAERHIIFGDLYWLLCREGSYIEKGGTIAKTEQIRRIIWLIFGLSGSAHRGHPHQVHQQVTLRGNERPIVAFSGPAICSRGTAVQRHTPSAAVLHRHWETTSQLQTSPQRRGATGLKGLKGGI
jgi:hypothetical protein